MLIGIAIAAFCMTLAGGLLALKSAQRLPWVSGFSAGAVIAVALFDLLPEAFELQPSVAAPQSLLAWTAAGFLAYLCVDRAALLSAHSHADPWANVSEGAARALRSRGALFAGSLSLHSVLDGIGIGLAFQASSAVGWVVAAAVLTHDLADGFNTMSVVLRHRSRVWVALRWLLADALAPGIGMLSTRFFAVGAGVLSMSLAVFAGFFLYIGACDLLPESHRVHPNRLTTVMTLMGSAVLYEVIALARRML